MICIPDSDKFARQDTGRIERPSRDGQAVQQSDVRRERLAISLPRSFAAILAVAAAASGAHALPAADSNAAARRDLVSANHILVRHSVLDGWGHVSVRSPTDPSHFYIARSMPPAEVMEADILEVDIKTCGVIGAGSTYLERFIHCETYRSHPELQAVVHSHSPSFIPFGLTRTPLMPLYHVVAFLGGGTGFFDIRQAAGDGTDMLVRTPALGVALSQALGDHPIVMMRGHGATIAGQSLQQAVYRAIYAETGAQIQLASKALGEPTPLSPAEARAAAAAVDQQMGRVWKLWLSEAGRN